MAQALYMRRCHICGETTINSEKPINQCEHCGKSLAVFCYYDEREVHSGSDLDSRPFSEPIGSVRPIFGVSVFWDEERDVG